MPERSSLDDWLDREAADAASEAAKTPTLGSRSTYAYDDSGYRRLAVLPLSCPKGMTYDPGPTKPKTEEPEKHESG